MLKVDTFVTTMQDILVNSFDELCFLSFSDAYECMYGAIVKLFVPDAPCPCPLPAAKQKADKYSCFTL